ncbi:hypothetical protein [Listeria seeligeri]|uniref:hypothetical protein n=1 Tax=Listeria seeligeri TaxID=1640 RepID=UPI0022EA5389|nr:hypothetical protein [Listeria seeligeri]
MKEVIIISFSIIVSIIAVLISSMGSYIAFKNYMLNAAPSLVFKRLSINYIGNVTVEMKNIGKGLCSKTFIILETQDGDVIISQPVMDIAYKDVCEKRIGWESKLRGVKYNNIYAFTMDANGNYFSFQMDKGMLESSESHLIEFDGRMQSANYIGVISWKRRLKLEALMKKARTSCNTYSDYKKEQ